RGDGAAGHATIRSDFQSETSGTRTFFTLGAAWIVGIAEPATRRRARRCTACRDRGWRRRRRWGRYRNRIENRRRRTHGLDRRRRGRRLHDRRRSNDRRRLDRLVWRRRRRLLIRWRRLLFHVDHI